MKPKLDFETAKHLVKLAAEHGFKSAQIGKTLEGVKVEIDYWFKDAIKVANKKETKQ